jgi:hypothetical protein
MAVSRKRRAQPRSEQREGGGEAYAAGTMTELDRRFAQEQRDAPERRDTEQGRTSAERSDAASAEAFRHLETEAERTAIERERGAREREEGRRREEADALLHEHLTDEAWRSMIARAREAAERGESEFLLAQFPSELCGDGGRAVNAPSEDWPDTLRGLPREIYERWQRELKEKGFRIGARVLDFPGGFPGTVGLFLVWGG